MNKDIELSIACMNLMKAIKNGNKPLTDAEYQKRWDDYNRRNQKLRNLKKRA